MHVTQLGGRYRFGYENLNHINITQGHIEEYATYK